MIMTANPAFEILKETIKSILPVFFRFWWLWLLVLIVFAARLIINSPRFKGRAGEKSVAKSLSVLPENEYKLINDLLLPAEESFTSQIDHVVLSCKGIFVIETKNYSGIISGSEKSSEWTQNIYGNKHSFKNPVFQNYGHIKALEKALSGFSPLKFYSVIAFPEKAKLNVKAEKTPVIYYSEIAATILRTEAEISLSPETVDSIRERLISLSIDDRESRKAHNAEANSKKTEAEKKVSEGICPVCGGKLLIRNGKNGQFYGCSSYPKCRYTHSIY